MKNEKSILVIDDEDSICLAFKRFFEHRGWKVETAASVDNGLKKYLLSCHTVVFLDIHLPDKSGLELLEKLTGRGANVVMITAYGGLDTVVQAIQGKAYDYLSKPLDLDKALEAAGRILQSSTATVHNNSNKSPDRSIIVGKSPAMQEVYKLVARAAASDSPVLIEGETGTGKELVASAIHRFSLRCDRPFVAVNCGAIPQNLIESELFGHVRGAFTGADFDRIGRFECAEGGTLLLDEIGELPLSSQVKLLRVLDNGIIERVGSSQPAQLNVRIIAATNRKLLDDANKGRFREDLFYRLSVLSISLPPLRRRIEDIPLLAHHFLSAKYGSSTAVSGFTEMAIHALTQHYWRGNVRELRNAIEHAVAVAPDRPLAVEDLPLHIRHGNLAGSQEEEFLKNAIVDYIKHAGNANSGKYRGMLELAEHAMINHALERCKGNQSDAADYLGMHRNTLRKKIRELNTGDTIQS